MTEVKTAEQILEYNYYSFRGTRFECDQWENLDKQPNLKECIILCMKEYASQFSPSKGVREEEIKDWSKPVDGIINVPDELDGLVNQIGMNYRLHRISKRMTEPEFICRAVFLCQKHFQSHPSQADGELISRLKKFDPINSLGIIIDKNEIAIILNALK